MTETRKEVLSPAGKPRALTEKSPSPQLQLLRLEEIIRAEQRKIEAEIEGMCADLRRLLAAPSMSMSELPRWQKVQKDLKQLLTNPTYCSHSEFRIVVAKFIALDLATIPVGRDDSTS